MVYINKKICIKPSKKIKKKDLITIKLKFQSKKILKNKTPLNIIYEDKFLLIINKQKNIIIHPSNKNENNTILNSIIFYYPNIYKNVPKCGIVHRLDKNTTGLIMIAKDIDTYQKLKKNIKNKNIIRIYTTIVYGKLKLNKLISTFISRNKNKRTTMRVSNKGKKAITNYQIIEKFNFCTLLKITLHTGRTHQIRVHMNYIKHPIIGEKIYTNKNIKNIKISKFYKKKIKLINSQLLHAQKLILDHPKYNNKIEINSPLPQEMINFIFYLRHKNIFIKNQ